MWCVQEGGGASAWAQQLGVAGAVPEKKPDDDKPDGTEGPCAGEPLRVRACVRLCHVTSIDLYTQCQYIDIDTDTDTDTDTDI